MSALLPHPPAPQLVAGFSELAASIDVLICDVWGVVHNGQKAHRAACHALEAFRAGGGTVVFVSNAPRPAVDVIPQLTGFGVLPAAYDRIVTSGDMTRLLIAERAGQRLAHIGPDRDLTLFAGLDLIFAPPAEADYCICSGFADDEVQTPADYAAELEVMARRGLTMICANPDLVVERGARLIPCAGAIAEAYAALGGAVIHAGKPHLPIYRRALELAADVRGAATELSRVAAVGDAIRTDVAGAAALGVRSILLLDGIHWHDAGGDAWPQRMEPWLAAQAFSPHFVMARLVW